ncbi:unnamed protein product [Linum tenue]|uniref:GDSL esterase/lipase n=1 Tax=Linum tenue TaxID=586396 RepID=A0AAV0R188_9ROSI|nr:unnamed protein product [Linum tenue]
MGKRLPVSILFLALAPLLIIAVHAKVPAVIVFGDSSVDAGNNNFIPTVARSNFQPYGRDFSGGKATGRFSNGRIATDFISEAFGLRPTIPAYLDPAYNISDFAVGVTFASNFLAGIAEGFLRQLYGLGARKISLGGLPPMGCMPLERTTNMMGQRACVDRYNVVAADFNGKMNNLTEKLNAELPGAQIVFSNPYFPLMGIIRQPSLYGT